MQLSLKDYEFHQYLHKVRIKFLPYLTLFCFKGLKKINKGHEAKPKAIQIKCEVALIMPSIPFHEL